MSFFNFTLFFNMSMGVGEEGILVDVWGGGRRVYGSGNLHSQAVCLAFSWEHSNLSSSHAGQKTNRAAIGQQI